ncbi:unnamed protein product [Spirodela intermedia]|uniref:Uncharacterized protein n=1 Tax=Spirodela intermedia TaxID=51605 RepID=A0A7I8IM34_SPIIN|nr:unnamed protein product [Spirodela intermedia]CAA6658021.1 unnamed protein product [Spirodela intermedia]
MILIKGNKKKIKAWSMTFSCPRSLWRRDYLEHIKIITDQASLGLGLTPHRASSTHYSPDFRDRRVAAEFLREAGPLGLTCF